MRSPVGSFASANTLAVDRSLEFEALSTPDGICCDGAAVNPMVMETGDLGITAGMQRRDHAMAMFTVVRAESRNVA